MIEWIPVTERVPDEGQECLVYSQNTDDDFGRFAARWHGGMWITNGGIRFNRVHMSHWMPLPPLPEKK